MAHFELHTTLTQPRAHGSTVRFLRALISRPEGAFGVACVCLLLFTALFATLIAPYDPIKLNVLERLQAPSLAHLMGTDQLGRDVLSRIIFGTQTALVAAASALAFSLAGGLVLGLIAGYGPRLVDTALLLLFDSVKSLPVIIMALALVTLLGPSLTTVVIVVVVFTLPGYARMVRSQTQVLKRSEYVLAARAMGASPGRILLRHILPNLFGPLIVLVCMDVTTVITVESGLAFIGLGAQPPTPSWGSILNDGFSFIQQAWYLVAAAGLPIVIATIGFNFLGEAIRDVLDPKNGGTP
ncbi:ABC transporter permease [Oleomonas cavernae]|uniref:ABC transporter permease n=1 Tax=Oleomonas cavernae TaxID=2320859 RepID=UPI001F39FBE4|nr:ABC transporter permease [Oleomonas cavernae]